MAVQAVITTVLGGSPAAASGQTAPTDLLFLDEFSRGLERWHFPHGRGEALVDGGSDRGAVLQLRTVDQQVYALMEGSEGWGDVRIEGMVSFPEDRHNYLGFIYRWVDDGRRIDFGSLYIKGNGSYAQANPHNDTNVGRTLYPETQVDLTGNRAIMIGEWKSFALEVVGGDAHLYVGDMDTPALTLVGRHAERGAFGLKPRNPGARVLIDDIRVWAIDGFSHQGPPIPDPAYDRDAFVTEWSVLGPLTRSLPVGVEGIFDPELMVQDDGRSVSWRPLATDHRGAVVTGAVTEHRGSRRVAYFHTVIESARGGNVPLLLSSTDDLSIWVNGVYRGAYPRQDQAWWDSASNPEHRPARVFVTLEPGANDLVLRTAGGVYAAGGFYLAVQEPGGGG